MTDSSYTHILAIVDRSGSMSWNRADKEMAAALNTYFREQGEVEGKCLVDYVQFDNTSELLYHDKEVAVAEAFIIPRGSTALLDAIGKAVTDLGRKLARLPEALRPGQVQVVIVTDGEENASRIWNADKVKKLITDQTDKYKWDFVFLGANIDAVNVADTYGIPYSNAMEFDLSAGGIASGTVTASSMALANYTTTYRGGNKGTFTDDDRDKAMNGTS